MDETRQGAETPEVQQQPIPDAAPPTAEELAARLADAERTAMRAQVALEVGLPAELAGRLQGETPEEVTRDARELMRLVGTRGRVPGAANPGAPPPGRTDAQRRREYFGGGEADHLWQGGKVLLHGKLDTQE